MFIAIGALVLIGSTISLRVDSLIDKIFLALTFVTLLMSALVGFGLQRLITRSMLEDSDECPLEIVEAHFNTLGDLQASLLSLAGGFIVASLFLYAVRRK